MSIAEQAGLVLEPGPCIARVFGLNESKSKMKIKSTKRITSKRLTPALRPRRADPAIHHVRRIVADLPHLPAVQIQPLLLVEMQRPAAAVRDAHQAHGRVYAYLFGWPARNRALGACHGIDIPFPFGNFVEGWPEFTGADVDAYALSRFMRDAWAAFARTGDPGWPTYPATMILGRHQHVAPSHPLFGRLLPLQG